MDILDSFGDFVQLGLVAVGIFVITFFIQGGFRSFWIYPFILHTVIWRTVYDYDIVLGLILGSIVGILTGISMIKNSVSNISERQQQAQTSSIWAFLQVIVVCVTKIVLFW